MKVKKYYRINSNGEKTICIDIYDEGKRRRQTLGLRLKKGNSPEIREENKKIEAVADARVSQIKLELYNERFDLINSSLKSSNFVTYFQREVDRRPPDRTSWKNTLQKIIAFGGDKIPFSHIDTVWLEGFKKFLESKISNTTSHHYYSNVKYVLNKAFKENIITRDPSKIVPNIKLKEVQRNFLEEVEIRKLVNTPCKNINIKNAFLFSCYTGLRLSDVEKLTWESIRNDKITYIQKKTSTPEVLYLNEFTKHILNFQKGGINITPINPAAKVFQLPTRSPLLHTLKKWVKSAGIEKRVSFHVARHTFATLSITMGVDIYTVSKLLGHKDVQTTQKYAKVIDLKKEEAIKKLPQMVAYNE